MSSTRSIPASRITYRRNPDWWGKDLPFNRGQWNFDTIRYDYFGNPVAVFESVKTGGITAYREDNLAKWASRYDFPGHHRRASMVKLEVPHERPSGIIGLVMNTRKPQFRRLAGARGDDRDFQLRLRQPDRDRRRRPAHHLVLLEQPLLDAGRQTCRRCGSGAA